MKLLTPDEQRTLLHRYKQSDLYRQWSPILATLQRQYDEADAQTLWHVAEQQIVKLRSEQAFREQEIAPIYNELLGDCQKFDASERTKQQACRTASTVMCIMLTMLMNAVEKGCEDESFDNEPMCMAIMDILSEDTFFQGLMNLFFKRDTGYDGKKVVITPSDPMLEKTIFESMDDMAKEEIKQMVKNIVSRTQGLKTHFGDYWKAWEPLWQDICADSQFVLLMKNEEPRTIDWGMNQKMVCNVVGMFKDQTKLTVSIKAINDVLTSTNVRSYISNHAEYGGSNTVFTREQHDRVKQLIEKHILSTKDN